MRRKAPAKEIAMNKKLYVGNLSSEATEEELRFNFSQAGNVLSVSLIKDRMTGLNKGFGFVEMENEEGARKAIESFNGGELHGKVIVVSEAKPPKDRPAGGGFGRDRQGGFGRGPGRPGGGGRRY
jgi:RNA recognition motif-containing protein